MTVIQPNLAPKPRIVERFTREIFLTDGQYPDDEIFARPVAKRPNQSAPTPTKPVIGFKESERKPKRQHAASTGHSYDAAVARRLLVGGVVAVSFVGLIGYGFFGGGSTSPSSLASGSSTIPATVGTASSLPANQQAATSPATTASVAHDSAPTTLSQNSVTTQPTVPPVTAASTTTTRLPPTTVVVTTTTAVTSISAASSATTLPPGVNPANASITVRVANATNVAGAATSVTEELGRLDFNVLGPANAPTTNPSATVVYYAAGFQVAGDAVARILGVPQSQIKQYSSGAVIGAVAPSDVNVVLGLDVAAK